jgi:steroid delta-isomerase-like uncharacterized protein
MNPHETIVTRYYAAFNARDFDAYATLFSADVAIEFPGVSARGLDAMRNFDRGWAEAFPESRLEVFRTTTADNHVAAAMWFNGGVQRGAMNTPSGILPATGKVLDVPGFVMFTFDGDRIARQQIVFEPTWIGIKLGIAN